MARPFGIHTIVLHEGVDGAQFERFMADEVFPAAAETPGSISRGGRSAIKSQHLLKADGDGRKYLWIVKGDAMEEQFPHIFERMYEDLRANLHSFGEHKSSATFVALASFEVGPRDQLGRPTGSPVRDSEI